MRTFLAYILLLGALFLPAKSEAQLFKKAEQLLQSSFAPQSSDTVTVTADSSMEQRLRRDSLLISELLRRIEDMEQMGFKAARAEMEKDSLLQVRQRLYFDSLRRVTPGAPIVVDEDTVLMLYAGRGGYSAADRAEMASAVLLKIVNGPGHPGDSLYLLENERFIDVMYGSKVIVSVTEQDALLEGVSPRELAERYLPILDQKIKELQEEHSLMDILRRVALFLLVVFAQYLLFRLTNKFYRRMRRRIIHFGHLRLKPFVIRDYELLNKRRICRIMVLLANVLRCFVLLIQLMFSLAIIFSIFPQTKKLVDRFISYIYDPVKMIVVNVVEYIPNLFIIIVIWLCVRYIIKGLRYITQEIQNEKLKISGFYPDWAQPTFNIIRFLLYAFMIAMIYPYLPGSKSGVFQGISVFVGLIISLGSSTVIGNVISGFVITYMRPFKIGDHIKLNDTTGNVIEKTPLVTRLRTRKNELVTIPNSFIMSSHTINYSSSARRYGLIIHQTITVCYDVPWRKVHTLLTEAAMQTKGVLDHPSPFVLETEFQDYYSCYQINVYIKDADQIDFITSDLLEHIQDHFKAAGIDLVAPHFYAHRE